MCFTLQRNVKIASLKPLVMYSIVMQKHVGLRLWFQTAKWLAFQKQIALQHSSVEQTIPQMIYRGSTQMSQEPIRQFHFGPCPILAISTLGCTRVIRYKYRQPLSYMSSLPWVAYYKAHTVLIKDTCTTTITLKLQFFPPPFCDKCAGATVVMDKTSASCMSLLCVLLSAVMIHTYV